jgi:hypothetical protein
MKLNHIRKFFVPAALTVFVAACTPAIDAPIPTRGKADFSNFVALGNSLTSGYGDGALYLEGQINSFPNIMATQFKAAGGGEFVQPLLPEGSGFGGAGNGRFFASETSNPLLKPFSLTTAVAPSITPASGNWRVSPDVIAKLNNFGVPGAKLIDAIVPGYGSSVGNPFFARFASSPTATMVGDAAARKPTFFTIGLGNNDVLGYATSGGTDSVSLGVFQAIPALGITLPAGGVNGKYPVSPVSTFTAIYDRVLSTMLASNTAAKGVVITVPDVTKIPFFNTTGPTLSSRGLTKVYFTNSRNSLDSLDTKKPATGLLTLTAGSEVARGFGVSPLRPLPSRFVLDPAEIAICQNALNAYNAHIRTKQSDRVAVLDIAPFIDGLVRGTTINGTVVNSGFISGGTFALDGVHLSPRGYAMVANEIIKTINNTFGSTILQVNPLSYDGIVVKK